MIQLLVGQQTGTATHQWTHRDKDILNLNDPTQLDCIDEAVNTWTYLTLMRTRRAVTFPSRGKAFHAGSRSTHATQPYCRKLAVNILRSIRA